MEEAEMTELPAVIVIGIMWTFLWRKRDEARQLRWERDCFHEELNRAWDDLAGDPEKEGDDS